MRILFRWQIILGVFAGLLAVQSSVEAEFDAGLNTPGARIEGSSRLAGTNETNAFDGNSSTFWQPPYSGESWLVRTFEVPMDITRIEFNAAAVSSYSIEIAEDASMVYKPVVTNATVAQESVSKSFEPALRALSVRIQFTGVWPRVSSVCIYSDTTSEKQSARRSEMRKQVPNVACIMSDHWWARADREQTATALSNLKWFWARFNSSDISELISRISDFDVIILGTFHSVPIEYATVLKAFMENGGTIIALDATSTGRYEWFGSMGSEYALKPVRYAEEGSPACKVNLSINYITKQVWPTDPKIPIFSNGVYFVTYGKALQVLGMSSEDYPVALTAKIGKGQLIATTLRADNIPIESILSRLTGKGIRENSKTKQIVPRPKVDTKQLLANGKPFFPIGLYRPPVSMLKELRKSGFNTVVHEFQPAKDFLDACAKTGLMVCPIIWNSVEYVKKNMDHPAILPWYMSDEPGGRNAEDPREITDACKSIQKLDTKHLTVVADNYPDSHDAGVDIIAPDVYPITFCEETGTGWPIWEIARKFRQLQSDPVLSSKRTWCVMQAFGGYGPLGIPSIKQERAMVYGAICLGATGILFYSWTEPARPDWNLGQEKELWKGIKQIAKELNALSPVLLSSKRVDGVKLQSVSEEILWSHRNLNNVDYIIACNWGQTASKAELSFSDRRNGTAIDQFSKRRVKVESGIGKFQLAPLETVCFRLR